MQSRPQVWERLLAAMFMSGIAATGRSHSWIVGYHPADPATDLPS
jgi:hypothetical protein